MLERLPVLARMCWDPGLDSPEAAEAVESCASSSLLLDSTLVYRDDTASSLDARNATKVPLAASWQFPAPDTELVLLLLPALRSVAVACRSPAAAADVADWGPAACGLLPLTGSAN